MPGRGLRHRASRADHGSGDGSGVGARVGFHHKTLAAFLGAFPDADLNIREAREVCGGGVVLPRNLAVVAMKTGAQAQHAMGDLSR
jgi:hypothetical protein